MPVDDRGLERPASRRLRADQDRAQRYSGQRETALLVDARIDGGAERGVGRLRDDADLREIGRRRLTALKGDHSGQRRARRDDDHEVAQILPGDGDRHDAVLRPRVVRAPGAQHIPAGWNVRDDEGAVPPDAAAEVHARTAAGLTLDRQVDVSGGDRRPVGVRDAPGQLGRANEQDVETDIEKLGAEAKCERRRFEYGRHAGKVGGRVANLHVTRYAARSAWGGTASRGAPDHHGRRVRLDGQSVRRH